MARLARGGFGRGDPAQRDQRVLEHQRADRAEQQDVEQADDEVDLARCLEQAEQAGAGQAADRAAGDHHPAHLEVDPAAARNGRSTPDTLDPVIWVVAEATATVGGMP